MNVDVNGTRLWFDVDGAGLVPDGPAMRERPTVVLLHGGPGSFDHTYFKPEFARLASVAQVVYLDLPGHGRSQWGDPESWSFEACADDVRGFCDALGIARPIVYAIPSAASSPWSMARGTPATRRGSCCTRRWPASTWSASSRTSAAQEATMWPPSRSASTAATASR